jgi:hypothetical protein
VEYREIERQFQDTSRNGAMWGKVPGKVQMLGSYVDCGIRVNSAILKLDIAGSLDADTSTLYQKKPQRRF